ncbi:MAG: GlsB/YeaQ/YmgE family stress response membrane protein [Chromatiaceae bacterium]
MDVTSLVVGLLLSFVLIGAGAGWLAGRLMPGSGLLGNVTLGISGAFAGGFLFGLAPLSVEDGLIGCPITAAIGATVFLFIGGLCRKA